MKVKGPGYVASSEQQYKEFKTLDKSLYKDINLDTQLPKVSNDMVRAHGAAYNSVAGAGNRTFCRHRAIAMLGLVDHTNGNGVTTKLTVTSEPCRWNHSKRACKGSPVKASVLEVGLKKSKTSDTRASTSGSKFAKVRVRSSEEKKARYQKIQ